GTDGHRAASVVKIALLAVVMILAAGCSGRQQLAPSRLVVLRFENLTGNSALDWMGRGAARQIGAQIQGAAVADSPQIAAERERALVSGPARILYGYVSQSGGRLRLRADIEDTASRQFRQSAEAAGPVSEGLLPLADAVASQLDPMASAGGARSEAALAAYVAALDAPDAGAASESLSRSIAADPNFGGAYLALIQLNLARNDNPAAERTLALARARGSAISPLDRARLDVAAAQLSGNPDTLSQSLAALSRLTPHDAGLLRNLGDTAQAAKRYPAAIDYYRKALDSQPGDPSLLNNLGYTQAYAGDLEGAAKSLGEYA